MPWRTFSRELNPKRRASPQARIQMSPRGAEAVGSRLRVAEFRQLEIILTARLPEVGSTESTGPARFSTTSS
jgi:hypothetical protein